ncbi:hypothetical protein LZ198_08735 [Myxococcus sp. K15C18031901]|uniref:hypothetical protein n=1 Tax=Myxococcus dinghuensis TaxID=2906761 RepID=UPI0020A72465|nr:hypothetical protein [Myxococcus dinghuensis]MCP3098961.1 hypothetical protein [Myxococcus dinghuensis]
MLALGLALVLAASTGEPPPAPEQPCLARDARGDTFPICFDPGDGVVVGVGTRMSQGSPALSLRAGVHLRTGRTSQSKATPWYNNHRLAGVEAWGGEQRGFTVTAYDGLLRRHLEEGFILVPTARPVRIPFPFDVSLALRAGHLERRPWEGRGWTLETGRVGLLVDPLRAASGRVWLALGPVASHTLRYSPQGTEHALSPFTSLMFDLGLETEDGLWALRASGLAGWNRDVEGGTLDFRARSDASLERVLIAVQDQPVAVRLAGSYVGGDAGLQRRDEWTLGVGLSVRAFSSRW